MDVAQSSRPRHGQVAAARLRASAAAVLAALLAWPLVAAGQAPAEPPAAETDEAAPPLPEVEMKATELGVRFTPGMAAAIGSALSRQMKRQYDLNDEQVGQVKEILTRQFLKLAHDAQDAGRDAIELMMEAMIENDGMLPPDAARKFAQTMSPILPTIEQFMKDTGKQVAKTMTVKQRLKFTRDTTAAMTGMAMFKERMSRWERGEVSGTVNPFFERPDPPRPADAAAATNEPSELQAARRNAEQVIKWRGEDRVNRWSDYVERAIEFYGLDEAQSKSAKSILADCQKRARDVQNDAWKDKVRANRIQRTLSYRMGASFNSGPWSQRLEDEFEALMKPIDDIADDMTRRIDALPTSAQRAAAFDRARQEFAKHGLNLPPA